MLQSGLVGPDFAGNVPALLAEVYDAVSDPLRWSHVLESLATLNRAKVALLSNSGPEEGKSGIFAKYGVSDENARIYLDASRRQIGLLQESEVMAFEAVHETERSASNRNS